MALHGFPCPPWDITKIPEETDAILSHFWHCWRDSIRFCSKADLVFTYTGTVNQVSLFNVAASGQPFAQGQTVSASITVPYIDDSTGRWSVEGATIYTMTQTFLREGSASAAAQFSGVPGVIDMPTLYQDVGTSMFPAVAGTGTNLADAQFISLWENVQVIFRGGGFTATYLPGGNFSIAHSVATGAGAWTATVLSSSTAVPEPAGLAVLVVGTMALAGVRRRAALDRAIAPVSVASDISQLTVDAGVSLRRAVEPQANGIVTPYGETPEDADHARRVLLNAGCIVPADGGALELTPLGSTLGTRLLENWNEEAPHLRDWDRRMLSEAQVTPAQRGYRVRLYWGASASTYGPYPWRWMARIVAWWCSGWA